jgi:hypothetical protein
MVQYTPRRDGMVLQISATDPTHPLSALIGLGISVTIAPNYLPGDAP